MFLFSKHTRVFLEPIRWLLNLQIQHQRCIYKCNTSVVVVWSVLSSEKKNFYSKTNYAISCVVNFYNAGVVTRDRRIGSSLKMYSICTLHEFSGSGVHTYLHIWAITIILRPKRHPIMSRTQFSNSKFCFWIGTIIFVERSATIECYCQPLPPNLETIASKLVL
jgi:hypothetical protein